MSLAFSIVLLTIASASSTITSSFSAAIVVKSVG
jgi:hypothetical protein